MDVQALLNKMSPREQKILYVVIGLLIVLMGYHAVWTPAQEKFETLNNEIFAMQMKIRKAKTFLRQKDDILEESQKYPNLEKMDAGTDEEEIAQLLNFIEQGARDTGVRLSDVKPQQVQSDKWSKRYVVELNAESGVSELIEFVYLMQHSEQLLKIDRIDTAPKEEQSGELRSFIVVTRVVVK